LRAPGLELIIPTDGLPRDARMTLTHAGPRFAMTLAVAGILQAKERKM
jgi:hypothetical protein